MRAPAAALAAFLLSGCWEGDLYTDADARPAIAPGTYRVVNRDAAPLMASVTILPNGMTRLDTKSATLDFPVVPLEPEGRRILHWSQLPGPKAPADGSEVYSLILRDEDGGYTIHALRCGDAQREIARAAGADVGRTAFSACRFKDRATLERALREVRPDPGGAYTRLVPVANGQG